MLSLLRRKKGQNTAEYAILIAIIIGAAIAMQTYVKRGLQRGISFAVNNLSSGESGTEAQYEPDYLVSEYQTTEKAHVQSIDETKQGGEVIRTFGNKTVERAGSQITEAPSQ